MKFFWLFIFLVASCKAVTTNGFSTSEKKRADHVIEITFVNAGANYSTVVGIIQENGFNPQIQYYPIGDVYPSLMTLSFTCYNMTPASLGHLKSAVGSCSGVITVNDTVIR
jgi:hypothetical protein